MRYEGAVGEVFLCHPIDVGLIIHTHTTARWTNMRAMDLGTEFDHAHVNQSAEQGIPAKLECLTKPDLFREKTETAGRVCILLVLIMAVGSMSLT